MAYAKSESVRVNGDDLRFLRKRKFPSAEAFAAACESVSVPTIYRAERGGPILKPYLGRMARELEVKTERLIATEGSANRIGSDLVLTGDWRGLYVATDRYGQPYLIREDVTFVQNGTRVEGHSEFETREGKMRDKFVYSTFKDNVFIGQTRSQDWPFPLDSALFALSGTRNFTRLDGYLCWFDLDTERPEFSKYILIRRKSPRADAELSEAQTLLDSEIKLMQVRRLVEAGYSFEKSVKLMVTTKEEEVATKRAAPASSKPNSVKPKLMAPQKVVAVSGIAVLDDDPMHRFFADGLADDIATDLARAPGIEVIPRASLPARDQAGTNSAQTHAQSHVLSGSMRRSTTHLRLNVHLTDVHSGKIVWAERIEYPTGANAAALEQSISGVVVKALCRELAVSAPETARLETADPVAYELFLKGRSLYLRGLYTHSMRAAEALVARAIERDPSFARAHAQRSICKSHLVLSTTQSGETGPVTDGVSDAERALSIDPDLPLGHAALGLARYAIGEYAAAELALRKAVELDPQLFEGQFLLARHLRLKGDRAGAAERFAKAVELRPEDFRASGLLGEELQALNRQDDATARFRSTLDLVERALQDHPDNAGALAFGAAVLADLDMPDRAAIWADWALTIAPNDCLVRYNIARMHAIFGDNKAALDHLQNAFTVPPVAARRLALWMQFDEDFAGLRDYASYQRLLNAEP
ncbi:MAG: hypothetical protein AAFY35_05080 [Pseudomonadota bacterium]